MIKWTDPTVRLQNLVQPLPCYPAICRIHDERERMPDCHNVDFLKNNAISNPETRRKCLVASAETYCVASGRTS